MTMNSEQPDALTTKLQKRESVEFRLGLAHIAVGVLPLSCGPVACMYT